MRDLRPYVCTFANCNEGDQLYDTFKDWVGHETRSHRSEEPRLGSFEGNQDYFPKYYEHANESRNENLGGETHPDLRIRNDQHSLKGRWQCPICLKGEVTLSHIGLHLQKIALFALPRSTGIEEGSNQGNARSVDKDQDSQNTRDFDELDGLPPYQSSDVDYAPSQERGVAIENMETQRTSLTLDALESASRSAHADPHTKVDHFLQQLQEDAKVPTDATPSALSPSKRLPQPEPENGNRRVWAHGRPTLKEVVSIVIQRRRQPRDRKWRTEPLHSVSKQEGERNSPSIVLQLMDYVSCVGFLSTDHPDRISVMANPVVKNMNQVSSTEETHDLEDQVSGIKSMLLNSGHADTLTTMANLASHYERQRRYKLAEELQVKILVTRKNLLGSEHEDTLSSMAHLVSLYVDRERWSEAEDLAVKVLSIRQKISGINDPDTISFMNELVVIYRHLGKVKEATLLGREVMEKRRSMFGEEHPTTISAMEDLANALMGQGQFDQAVPMLKKVLELRQSVFGDQDLGTVSAMANLVGVLEGQGMPTKAREMQEQMLLLKQRILGTEHPDTMLAMASLARLLYNEGKLVEAREMREQVLLLQQRTLGPEHPDTLSAMNSLAYVLETEGKLDQARAMREQMLELRQGTEYQKTTSAMVTDEKLLRKRSKLDDARYYY